MLNFSKLYVMFLLAETIFFFSVTYSKIKEKTKTNEKRCKKTCWCQVSSYEHKEKEKKIKQLAIKNLSKGYNRKKWVYEQKIFQFRDGGSHPPES
jgi:hypothetical protein